MSGAPGRAVAGATAPDESTIAGSMDSGSAAPGGLPGPPGGVGGHQPGDGRVRGVGHMDVTLGAAAQHPAQPRVDRAEAQLVGGPRPVGSTSSKMAASLVADAFGASRRPSAWSTRQVPTVRRSCHPMPGPTGSPLARSQTMADARWLAMPTPATGPAACSTSVASSTAAAARAGASSSTRPGAGVMGRTWRWRTSLTEASATRWPPARRRCHVDHQQCVAHHKPLVSPPGHGAGPNAEGSPSLPGFQDAGRVECGLHRSRTPKAPRGPRPRTESG